MSSSDRKKPDAQTIFLGAALLLAAAILTTIWLNRRSTEPQLAGSEDPSGPDTAASAGNNGSSPAGSDDAQAITLLAAKPGMKLAEIPFDSQQSYAYLRQLCELGPRFSGSPGMRQQQRLLESHFQSLGGNVQWQRFRVRHPQTGQPVDMANLIVPWHPDRRDRIILCAHYDTRPFPDRDPDPAGRKGIFLGANDGASGVALLMELGKLMPGFESKYGVDFVLFDGEELVYDDKRDPYFLGSRYFALQYVKRPPPYRYRAAVLLDMVGDKSLQIYKERHSMSWRDSRHLVEGIWQTAREMGVTEFIPRLGYEIRDDHLMLHDVGGIPACDIIDFDYGPPGTRTSYWHTREDTPDKCSGESLAKVAGVVWAWLNRLE